MKLAPKLTFFTLFLIGVNFFFATVAASQTPTIQASNIVISNLTSTTATISWTNGNGTKRAVFIENPSGTAAAPYDNISYSASSDWNNKGEKIGTSNYYCVYNGTGNSVTVTNLPPDADFAVRISEYNGSEDSEQYLTTIVTDNPKTFSTPATSLPPPTTQASDIVISNITSNSATISWTNGNGSNRVVFVESPSGIAAAPYNNHTYSASSDWNNKGTKIGSSNYYCVYNGSGNSVTLTNLPPNSQFAVRISEYNGSVGSEQYLTTIVSGNPKNFSTPAASLPPPTTQASNIIISNITASSAIISWTNGNGSKRVVFVESPSGIAAAPYNSTTYSASSDWNNKGTKIGSSNYYCVYNGSGNSVTLTNLPPDNDFTVRISEYNGSEGSEGYLTQIVSGNPATFMTLESSTPAPTVQASNIVVSNITSTAAAISWTNGNGSNRVVFVENPSGTAAAPYNNNTYSASSDWNNKGTKIGSSNYYCVYNGNGNSVNVTNLPPSSNFAVRISEYNGSAGNELYLTTLSTGNPENFSTLDATTAIIENEANNSAKIRISPNPTSDVIIVTCNQDIKESVAITISDLNGKLIHNCISHTKTTEFDLTNNPTGFYIVKVEVDGITSVTKVIKI